jgi:hypothetical protein
MFVGAVLKVSPDPATKLRGESRLRWMSKYFFAGSYNSIASSYHWYVLLFYI